MNQTLETNVTMHGQYWGILAQFGLLPRHTVSALYDAANDRPEVTYSLTDDEIRAIRATVASDRLDAVNFPRASQLAGHAPAAD